MKKRGIIFYSLILILILFPLISAIEFEMKTDFSQNEVFLAKISGDFSQPLTVQDIKFYRRHMQTSIIPEIIRIDDKFYLYASLEGKIPDNYSINIGGDSKNFTINGSYAEFLIDRGFVITEKDFSIKITNLKNSKTLIKSNFNSKNNSFFFVEKESKKINLPINEISETSLLTLKLSTENLEYEIPVYVFVNEKNFEEVEENKTSENISDPNEKEIIPSVEIISISTKKTCAEMNGTICQEDEKCDGNSAYVQDGLCCLKTCNKVESDDGWKIFGWILLVVATIIIFFIRQRYKNIKSKIDLLRNVKK